MSVFRLPVVLLSVLLVLGCIEKPNPKAFDGGVVPDRVGVDIADGGGGVDLAGEDIPRLPDGKPGEVIPELSEPETLWPADAETVGADGTVGPDVVEPGELVVGQGQLCPAAGGAAKDVRYRMWLSWHRNVVPLKLGAE